jgi:hypothetical protein
MKSFQEWKNQKQYLELQFNPNAATMPPVTNPNFRGVQPVMNTAATANPATANNAAANNAAANNAAAKPADAQNQPIDSALQNKLTRIISNFGGLPAQKQAELLGAVDDHVAGQLAAKNKTGILKGVARDNIQQGRKMLQQGKNFTAPGIS